MINKRKPVNYTYIITHHLKDGSKMYYHGMRTEKNPNLDHTSMDVYCSSSRIVKELYKHDPTAFTKEIERFHETREDAAKWEEYFHYKHDVAHNPNWYNLRNAHHLRTQPSNRVVAKVINSRKLISLKSEQFKLLKDAGIVTGSMSNTVTAIDKETGEYVRICSDEFNNNRGKYEGVTSGKVIMFNTLTEETRYFLYDELKNISDDWVKYSQFVLPYIDKNSEYKKENSFQCRIDHPKVISGEFIRYSEAKGMVTIWDEFKGIYRNIPKDEYDKGNYISAAQHRDKSSDMHIYVTNGCEEEIYISKQDALTYELPIRNSKQFLINYKKGKAHPDGKKRVPLYELLKTSYDKNDIVVREVILFDRISSETIITDSLDPRRMYFVRYKQVTRKDMCFVYTSENGTYVYEYVVPEELNKYRIYAIRTPGTNEFTICGEYGELKTDAQNLTRSLKRYESSKNKVYRK